MVGSQRVRNETVRGAASRRSALGYGIVEEISNVKPIGPVPAVHRSGSDVLGKLLDKVCEEGVESRRGVKWGLRQA